MLKRVGSITAIMFLILSSVLILPMNVRGNDLELSPQGVQEEIVIDFEPVIEKEDSNISMSEEAVEQEIVSPDLNQESLDHVEIESSPTNELELSDFFLNDDEKALKEDEGNLEIQPEVDQQVQEDFTVLQEEPSNLLPEIQIEKPDVFEEIIETEVIVEPEVLIQPLAITTEIYVNGVSGDDTLDGSTKLTAVKTFERAKTLALENLSATRIYVVNTVSISGDVSLSGTNAILIRDPEFTGLLLRVPSGNIASLSNIIIDGNIQSMGVRGSLIEVNGSLTILSGTSLQNNQMASSAYRSTGGALKIVGGTVVMSGGEILNNSATMGGGVLVSRNGHFEISGGIIHYNRTINGPDMAAFNDAGAGGGVALDDGATFIMSGSAIISNNSSSEVGGGVSVGTLEVSFGSNTFEMNGGTLSNNTSRATGGGLFVQAGFGNYVSSARISAGTIVNNRMLGTGRTNFAFGGGGIYVNGYADGYGFTNGILYLENVLVTDNIAAYQGGGYASCPVSETKIYVTSGGLFYDNTARNVSDDLFILSGYSGWGAHGGNPEYEISPIMLGGQPYYWKNVSNQNEVPIDALSGVLVGEWNSVQLYTDQDANDSALSLAKVIITNNSSSTRGGGIGSNGTVIIGQPTDKVEIEVTKEWENPNNFEIVYPENIFVDLMFKTLGSSEEPVRLTSKMIVADENGVWKASFTNLPKHNSDGSLIEYSVKERPIIGFESLITGDQENGFVITNIPLTVNISVEKIWDDNNDQDGIRPDSVMIHLLSNNELTGLSLELNETNNFKGEFKNLQQYKNELKIEYSVQEELVEGYESVVTGNVELGYVITNTHLVEKININGHKVWLDENNQDGIRPQSITVRLFKGDIEIDSQELNGPEWNYSFDNLDKYENGVEINYTIQEDFVEGYETLIEGLIIHNTHNPSKIDINVIKVWDDSDDKDQIRPESVTINLLADGKVTPHQLVLNQANNWSGTFENLDEYQEGQKILYTISEKTVEGYTVEITGNSEEGFVVTNKHTPDKPIVPVEPEEPVKPEKPDTPNKPELPNTGYESTNYSLVGSLFILSSAFISRKKRK